MVWDEAPPGLQWDPSGLMEEPGSPTATQQGQLAKGRRLGEEMWNHLWPKQNTEDWKIAFPSSPDNFESVASYNLSADVPQDQAADCFLRS